MFFGLGMHDASDLVFFGLCCAYIYLAGSLFLSSPLANLKILADSCWDLGLGLGFSVMVLLGLITE